MNAFRRFPLLLASGALIALAGCSGSTEVISDPPPPPPTDVIEETVETVEIPERPPMTTPEADDMGGLTFDPDTVRAGRFDNGRMFTLDDPPLAYFEETYDFSPDEEWFRR
ncbi:MAG: hypothetical protein AAFQ43_15265, partial [Bacteroidota bacterium]